MKRFLFALLIFTAFPAWSIDATHDCGGLYPTSNIDWFGPGGPADQDHHVQCQNYDIAGNPYAGKCNDAVTTKTRTVWDVHMTCTSSGGSLSCEIHGLLACNGASQPYALTCNGPDAAAFGNQAGSICTDGHGHGVTCACDSSGSGMHCSTFSPAGSPPFG